MIDCVFAPCRCLMCCKQSKFHLKMIFCNSNNLLRFFSGSSVDLPLCLLLAFWSPQYNVMQMYCCASSKPCCLRSTSKLICEKSHNAHCPDCKLHSADIALTAEESSAVIGGEQTAKRLQKEHSRRFLQAWAQLHRVRNYKRLPHDVLCGNIIKALCGDNSVRSKERAPRRTQPTRRQSKRRKINTVAGTNEVSSVTVRPDGYRSCICGTEECKQTMYNYFSAIHDYAWPEKYFPWLYVRMPSKPKVDIKNSTRGARARDQRLARAEKARRRSLFLKHLRISADVVDTMTNQDVAFPVHFPLCWFVSMCISHSLPHPHTDPRTNFHPIFQVANELDSERDASYAS